MLRLRVRLGYRRALALAVLGATTSSFAAVRQVQQQGLAFVPATVAAAPGDTIRWIWTSGVHTVTSGTPCSADGIYFDAPLSSSNPVVEFVVPDGVAQIPYFCRPHCGMGMTGLIRVSLVNLQMTIDGFQETPPTGSTATGTGTATLDTTTNEFSWNIQFSGLSSAQTAAHFHGPADPCGSAGVQIALPLGSPISGSMTLSAQQAADVLAGLWYVNIHSTNFPGGEIRGRVVPTALADPIPAPIPAGDLHVELETVASGLTAPNWGTFAPGVAGRLFVTDQNGILWSIDLAGGTKTTFLDVSARLVTLGIGGPNTFDERGLLGVAFHPDYQTNGLLYTYTSEPVSGPADFSTMPPNTTPNHQTVITEWQVPNPADPGAGVDPGSARELLRIDEPQFNHNAGCMNFGPDGMLYIALGDGGGRDDRDDGLSLGVPIVGHGCQGNGQNIESILGKLLRIDPRGNNSGNGQYGIPPDNPFVGTAGLDEIYAYGFRNPFRFSFDSQTGDLYVGDVGQNDIEEVDLVISGGNYGWRHKEGSFYFVFNGNQPGYVTDMPLSVPAGLIDPLAQYDHDEGVSVIGGFVYRGAKIPPLVGRYVFGDFARTFNNDGRLFYLDGSNAIREFQLVGQSELGLSLLGFGQDAQGELYVLANATGVPFGNSGVVLRIGTRVGDLDADGDVDLADLAALLAAYGSCTGDPGYNGAGDFDDSGCVDLSDLAMLLSVYGS